VNGVERFRVLSGWAWQRYYIFVEEGMNKIVWSVEGYETGDSAKIRHINLTNFPRVEEPIMIEATTMPKPLETISTFDVAQGWQRYQRSGPQGTELEFT